MFVWVTRPSSKFEFGSNSQQNKGDNWTFLCQNKLSCAWFAGREFWNWLLKSCNFVAFFSLSSFHIVKIVGSSLVHNHQPRVDRFSATNVLDYGFFPKNWPCSLSGQCPFCPLLWKSFIVWFEQTKYFSQLRTGRTYVNMLPPRFRTKSNHLSYENLSQTSGKSILN